jgi:hypothetical protein
VQIQQQLLYISPTLKQFQILMMKLKEQHRNQNQLKKEQEFKRLQRNQLMQAKNPKMQFQNQSLLRQTRRLLFLNKSSLQQSLQRL